MVTLGSFDDYHVVWNIVGKGSVAIDDIDLREVVREVSLIGETFEESKIVQGLLPFELAETLEIPLRGEPQLYITRSEAVHDLDGDGVAEAILTFTTYGDQIPQPAVVLGTRPRLSDVTSRFFPGGAPRPRHSPFTYFCDHDGDGREDIVFAEAGLDHPPWTGARIHVGLATKAGLFRDVSGADQGRGKRRPCSGGREALSLPRGTGSSALYGPGGPGCARTTGSAWRTSMAIRRGIS